MSNIQLNMSIQQFTTMAANMLYSGFVRRNKVDAKRDFKKLNSGGLVSVGTFTRKEDDAKLKLMLALDASEFKGVLTFHLFKKSLEQLLRNIALFQKEKRDAQTFTNKETGQVVVFIPGIIDDDGTLNVLVMGMEPLEDAVAVKLMYLDPDQFQKQKSGNDSAAAQEAVAEPAGEAGEKAGGETGEEASAG